ncbi:uncharacterized protein V6R79_023357 [Siganus canaliculatus]
MATGRGSDHTHLSSHRCFDPSEPPYLHEVKLQEAEAPGGRSCSPQRTVPASCGVNVQGNDPGKVPDKETKPGSEPLTLMRQKQNEQTKQNQSERTREKQSEPQRQKQKQGGRS